MVFLDLNLEKTYNKVSRKVLKKGDNFLSFFPKKKKKKREIIEFDEWARVEGYNLKRRYKKAFRSSKY